ncbi:MAG: hypothetical protein J6J83_00145 [Oscillospiraceae bacterium]|nr:hypothetical protein [Oscillospiraceae bacterium]
MKEKKEQALLRKERICEGKPSGCPFTFDLCHLPQANGKERQKDLPFLLWLSRHSKGLFCIVQSGALWYTVTKKPQVAVNNRERNFKLVDSDAIFLIMGHRYSIGGWSDAGCQMQKLWKAI